MELILRHTRMDITPCRDPAWMGSNTYYPPGVVCATDPSGASCLDTGDSGSGLVVPRAGQPRQYAWVGPLSFYRGCDRAKAMNLDDVFKHLSPFNGENPGVFTNGLCYLKWIAEQYGMTAEDPGPECGVSLGSREDENLEVCTTFDGEPCDFQSGFMLQNYLPGRPDLYDHFPNLTFSRCQAATVEGFTQMVFVCPVSSSRLAVCPNNCVGVEASNIIAGGAVLAASAFTSQALLLGQAALGLGLLTAGTGAAVARGTCAGPVFCQVGSQCCLVAYASPNRGYVCPEECW